MKANRAVDCGKSRESIPISFLIASPRVAANLGRTVPTVP